MVESKTLYTTLCIPNEINLMLRMVFNKLHHAPELIAPQPSTNCRIKTSLYAAVYSNLNKKIVKF